MDVPYHKFKWSIIIFLFIFFYCSSALGKSSYSVNIETICISDSKQSEQINKVITIKRGKKKIFIKNKANTLKNGDLIETDYKTAAILKLDSHKITMGKDTKIKILSIPGRIEGIKGIYHILSQKKGFIGRSINNINKNIDKLTRIFSFETKYTITALLGTEVYFSVDKHMKIPDVVVIDGEVEIRSKDNGYRFDPITLNSYQGYINGMLNADEKDSMIYKGLGQGRIIYTPSGSSVYNGGGLSIYNGGGSLYSNSSGQGSSFLRGTVFPNLGSCNYDEYDYSRIQQIKQWLARIEHKRSVNNNRHYRK